MSEREFDIVVIGMGPGGEDVAEKLAAAGLSMAAVEATPEIGSVGLNGRPATRPGRPRGDLPDPGVRPRPDPQGGQRRASSR